MPDASDSWTKFGFGLVRLNGFAAWNCCCKAAMLGAATPIAIGAPPGPWQVLPGIGSKELWPLTVMEIGCGTPRELHAAGVCRKAPFRNRSGRSNSTLL